MVKPNAFAASYATGKFKMLATIRAVSKIFVNVLCFILEGHIQKALKTMLVTC